MTAAKNGLLLAIDHKPAGNPTNEEEKTSPSELVDEKISKDVVSCRSRSKISKNCG